MVQLALRLLSYQDGSVQVIDDALLDEVLERARHCPRRRTNHNFHSGSDDNPHRFLNAMLAGTYVVPHRHLAPPKAESFVVLRGSVAVFVFDDEGRVSGRHELGVGVGGARGIDLPVGVWHSIAALSDEAVVFEVKPGPWDAKTDKELAPWAPGEDDPAAAEYLERLLTSE